MLLALMRIYVMMVYLMRFIQYPDRVECLSSSSMIRLFFILSVQRVLKKYIVYGSSNHSVIAIIE